MTAIDPSTHVAQLVLERPARARLFERLGIDYCCSGKRSLAEACTELGLDAGTVSAVLEALDEVPTVEAEDWTIESLSALCNHIVDVHHGRLRAELPRLSELLAKVERAHGDERPQLAEARAVFEELRGELELHMEQEERWLFPVCRAADRGKTAAVEPGLLEQLEDDHERVGALLRRLRELGDGYDLSKALCNTHRATLDGLHELELDMHQHIHEENNILFPRTIEALARS